MQRPHICPACVAAEGVVVEAVGAEEAEEARAVAAAEAVVEAAGTVGALGHPKGRAGLLRARANTFGTVCLRLLTCLP